MNKDDDRFVQEVRRLLDEQTEQIDPVILSRLRESRKLAVEKSERRSFFAMPAWAKAGAFATVTVAVVAVALWQTPPHVSRSAQHVEDMEIVAGCDHLDLYSDLDFYQWLASSQHGQ